jgi:branched-chain amino acid transport system permease protein
VVPALAFAAMAVLPFVVTPYTQDLIVRIAIFAIFALSLELLVGATGLVSLGHAAFLGIGAYATVLGSGDSGARAVLLALAVGGAALYAAVTGALSLRTRGVYFIMVTLAFAQLAYFVVHDTKAAGGSDGIFLYVKPVLEVGGVDLIDLDSRRHLYYTCWRPWPAPTPSSPCCCALASATRWPGSASTSSGCVRRASRPRPTSWPPSSSPARSPAWPASCWR